jgi:protein SCO1/2
MKKILTLAIILILSVSAFSEENPMDSIGIYEHLDEYIPGNLIFYDQDSNKVNIKESIDKPTVLVLVYYTCPGICSPLLDGVADVIEKSDVVLGEDYQVFTVSFNEDETPSLANEKRKNYLAQVDKDINEEAWTFFTGDRKNIDHITTSVGFKYKREGKDFIHSAAIIMLSPEGKITRYLYGTYFIPFDLKMAVIEAQEGRSGATISKVLKYCFSYDVENRKYVFNITKITATVVLAFALTFFLVLVYKKKKNPKTESK